MAVTGLTARETLLGIDYRPSNGVLYGVATDFNFGNNPNRLYTIDPLTGAATFVATLSAGLSTSRAGIDLNPVPDSQGLPSLRVVGDNEQNLRANADTGATIVDANVGVPIGASITGVAYTNNFFGATSTTLYGIDSTSDQLLRFTNPNAGTVVSVGALGVGANFPLGFDISGLTGVAYAAIIPEVGPPFTRLLYTINLETGQAALVGQIGTGLEIQGIAALPGAPIPEPTTMVLLGTGLAGIGAAVRKRRKP